MNDYQRQKEKLLSIYGTYCMCCGENNKRFLTLDHKNGKGKAHRDQFRKPTHKGTTNPAYAVYKDLITNFNPDVQVLCFNCNYAKKQYDYCPHRERVDILTGTVV